MGNCVKCGKKAAADEELCYKCKAKNAAIDGKTSRKAYFCDLCGAEKGKNIEFMKGKDQDNSYWPHHLQHLRHGGQLSMFLCFNCASREAEKSFCNSKRTSGLTHAEKCMYKYREANYYGDVAFADQIIKQCYQGGKDPMTFQIVTEDMFQ